MAKNVYQFVDVERIDPPKKPIMVRKQEFAEKKNKTKRKEKTEQ